MNLTKKEEILCRIRSFQRRWYRKYTKRGRELAEKEKRELHAALAGCFTLEPRPWWSDQPD